ncbi:MULTISPECIES: DUF6504 family protein [unclassified Frondihabitans]|jgi:hypothetical protein|uniref:DUF6504 family protein n=1 Tax=unclassified Frondihabitans TaxID=2626248 RepID=UPI000F4E5F5F|nr:MULTISPECIES: DUF6504 family protein [unclassified Frondihabitans]RPE75317.1 hypothetical protein EDF37_2926 [Frondihabitans sp. PhB153]RPF04559.1 hypothetical protein EDF39_2994 [Frondihabitans sp. PhB161]
MKIDERVPVETTDEGLPLRFTWRRVVYGVVSSPEYWITRQAWWASAKRAPRGAGADLIEMPVWRVDALPLTDGAQRVDGTFDLARDPVSHEWLLLGVFDDEVDQQLFA